MQRMAQLMSSSGEIIEAYRDFMIDDLHESLDTVKDHGDFRWYQGQIQGIRDFCNMTIF
jgi:hypothetical protein